MSPAARAALTRLAVEAGRQIHDARTRRGWTLRELADRAGVSVTHVHRAEAGHVVSLETHARLGVALGMPPSLVHQDRRGRTGGTGGHQGTRDAEDFVHAAMGELEARALAGPGRTIAIDEPYQHYQFAGRADVLAWDHENLLHVENRTRFPNVQEAAGAYNAKRQYLARALAERIGLGPSGWRSVTHVMACLWSAEVLHVLRLRRASFAALCPDEPAAFEAWLRAETPPSGTSSTLVVLDPMTPFGSRRRTLADPGRSRGLDPRYRGYADAAEALRRIGR
jgi:transcriptional regulator with XRE-family HTH domain